MDTATDYEKARKAMWDAWAVYCEAKRRFEAEERKAHEQFDRFVSGQSEPGSMEQR